MGDFTFLQDLLHLIVNAMQQWQLMVICRMPASFFSRMSETALSLVMWRE